MSRAGLYPDKNVCKNCGGFNNTAYKMCLPCRIKSRPDWRADYRIKKPEGLAAKYDTLKEYCAGLELEIQKLKELQ